MNEQLTDQLAKVEVAFSKTAERMLEEATTPEERMEVAKVLYTSATALRLYAVGELVEEISDGDDLKAVAENLGVTEDVLSLDLILYQNLLDTLV